MMSTSAWLGWLTSSLVAYPWVRAHSQTSCQDQTPPPTGLIASGKSLWRLPEVQFCTAWRVTPRRAAIAVWDEAEDTQPKRLQLGDGRARSSVEVGTLAQDRDELVASVIGPDSPVEFIDELVDDAVVNMLRVESHLIQIHGQTPL